MLGFILVTYNEPFFETITYKSLIASIKASALKNYKVFVYDNSDQKGWIVNYESIEQKAHIIYLHDSSNPGISVAYNRMAIKASSESIEWVILLDQDSRIPENAVQIYLNSIKKNENIYLKTPIIYTDHLRMKTFSPVKIIFSKAVGLRKIEDGIYKLKKMSFVNSGMMIFLPFFHKIGGYNEKIKLDFADFQFIEEAKKHTALFEVLPIIFFQNFSHFEKDILKALKRYAIYVQDLKNYKKRTVGEVFRMELVKLLHLLKLTLQHKSLAFINLTIRAYLSRNKHS